MTRRAFANRHLPARDNKRRPVLLNRGDRSIFADTCAADQDGKGCSSCQDRKLTSKISDVLSHHAG